MIKKIFFFIYGVAAYLSFLATYLYLIGFVGNIWVPKSIDSGIVKSEFSPFLINFALILLFAVQHAIMARPAFKDWWTRFIPKPIERSTFILITNLLLALMFWQWRPINDLVWQVEDQAAQTFLLALFATGWLLVVISSFLIDHFDLFGLRQVYLYLIGKPYTHAELRITGIYRYIRHPLMLGFIIGFWSTPVMTVGHLFFSIIMTAYILIGIKMEENNLIDFLGEEYQKYRWETPMLIPFLKKLRWR